MHGPYEHPAAIQRSDTVLTNRRLFPFLFATFMFVFYRKLSMSFSCCLGFCQYFLRPKLLCGQRNFRSEMFYNSVALCMKPITLKFAKIEIMLSVCWLTKYLSPLKTGTYQVVPTMNYRWQYPAVIRSRVVLSVHETSIFSEQVKCGLWVSCTDSQNLCARCNCLLLH